MPESKREQWGRLIGEQEASGGPVKVFCRSAGVSEHSFYWWRKRLREEKEPVRFALLERDGIPMASEASLELWLPGGERLRIYRGVDAGTLRTVLEALRR